MDSPFAEHVISKFGAISRENIINSWATYAQYCNEVNISEVLDTIDVAIAKKGYDIFD